LRVRILNKILFGHPEKKTSLGKPKHTCEDTIKMSQRNEMGV